MGIGHKYCHLIQRGDGYLYSYKESKFGFIAKAE